MMILDTNALIWLFFDDGKLGPTTRRAADDTWSFGRVAVPAITFWEIAMLREKGSMELVTDFTIWRASLFQDGLIEMPSMAKSASRPPRFPTSTAIRSTASLSRPRWTTTRS